MSYIVVDHSFDFSTKRRRNNSQLICDSPKLVAGINEIPRSKWQLAFEFVNNRKWLPCIYLDNFVDFRGRSIVALGTATFKWEFEDFPYGFKEGSREFDLYPVEMSKVEAKKIWDLENECLLKPNVDYTFAVKITLFPTTTTVIYNLQQPSVNVVKMQSDFGDLFKNGLYSDLVLVSEEKEFKVHKSIICSRSNVFKAMLESDMKEKNEGKVEIEDVKSSILEKMLIFLYTGMLENVDEPGFLENMFTVSEKYDIIDLKIAVSEKLCSGLTAENIGARLILADKFGEVQLRQKCLQFIRDNCDALSSQKSLLFQ